MKEKIWEKIILLIRNCFTHLGKEEEKWLKKWVSVEKDGLMPKVEIVN